VIKKDVLGIRDMSKEDLIEILNTAKEMKKIIEGEKISDILKGKTIITIFFEPQYKNKVII
jgi:Aspartate/ornithine carbamoyltransferase, carbamoyl-P binding domain.